MPGELDEQYIRARAALLDAAGALAPHLDSIVLVGAQAIYLHTGAADIVVAEFTTDADFSVEPALLSDKPLLTERPCRVGTVEVLIVRSPPRHGSGTQRWHR